MLGPLVGLTLWYLIAASGLISPLLVPPPSRVLLAAWDIRGDLATHVVATSVRIVAGYAGGVLLGGAVGVLMQYSRTVYVALDGVVETVRPVPPVAVVPFFILAFGFAEVGKLLLVTLGVGVVIVVTVVEAIERVPTAVLRWGMVAGLGRATLFRRVVLPASLPEMRGGARIGLALAVTLVVVSEFLGARAGLGYLISVSKITLSTPTLLMSVILLGWMGWGADWILRRLFDRATRWDVRASGALL